MPARRSLLRARWPLIALSLAIGLLLTLLTAFADDLLAPIRAHKQPLRQFAADDRVILVRESRTAWSVLQITIYGDRPDLSSSEVIALAARTNWSTDPLVANAALTFPRQRTDRVVMLRGWPFLALHCWIDPSNGSALQLPIPGAFNLKFGKWQLSIPYLPVWPGLAINLTLYSALASLGLTLPGWLRATIRTRRGLCIRCAYDLRDTPTTQPCPECGETRRQVPDQRLSQRPTSHR